MQCPTCGSAVYDNRPKKLSGEFKPNAPDFKCQNKACDWKQWPPKDKPSQIAAAPQFVPPVAPQPAPNGSRDAQLQELFWDSFDAVLAGIAKRRLVEAFKPEHLASLTATMFIQRAKG